MLKASAAAVREVGGAEERLSARAGPPAGQPAALHVLNSPAGKVPAEWISAFTDGARSCSAPSQGMGLAIAEGLVAEGANVAMFARRADVVEREAARIRALAVPGDLTRPADLDRLVTATVAAFGGIDIVVLNGGGPPPGAAAEVTPESVTAAVELLLLPHVSLVGLCLPHLRTSGRGRIIAIESTSVKEPIANLALSNAVRPGVVGWLKTLSRELGPAGITVNTIAPGRIDAERLRALYAQTAHRQKPWR